MKKLILLVLALAMTGCASMRGVDVGTESGGTYAISVTNHRSAKVNISYLDGETFRQLGSVEPHRTERFVIPSPKTPNVTVRAISTGGATVGTFNVALESGTTKQITVQ